MDNRILTLTPAVVDALNEELEYQAGRAAAGRTDGVHYGTPGQILTLLEYTQRALIDWVQNPGEDAALHTLRKCAAIAIRALLTEGCPRRGGKVFIAPAKGIPIGFYDPAEDYMPEVGAGAGD